MIEISTTSTATALTIGSSFGRKRREKIQIGRGFSPAPIVNVVTMISAKERAKASRPPAARAVFRLGKVTKRKVCQVWAPRSAEASSKEVETRRRRATTLL